MSEITDDDLFALLTDEINAVEMLKPNEVTIGRLAEQTGRSRNTVESHLARKVERGELKVVKKLDPANGRICNVYLMGEERERGETR